MAFMEYDAENCPLNALCERLGTKIDSCSRAAIPKYKTLEQMRHTYGGDAQLARLALIEEDIDRLRACTTSILKLLT
jgi:hypothetical protein